MPSPIHRAAAQPACRLRAAARLLIAILLLCCRLAHGELAPRPPILLLPIEASGARGAALTAAVARRLLLMGESVQQASARAPCQSRGCLSRVAEQHLVAWLLGGRVTVSGAACTVQLWLFDLNLAVATPSEARRDGCNAAALDDLVAATAGALAERHIPEVELPPPPTQPAAPPPPARPVVPPLPPAIARADGRSLLSHPQRSGIVVLSSLLGLALTEAILFTALDQQQLPGSRCQAASGGGSVPCVFTTKPYYIAGYALSGALALGLTLTIVLPTKGKTRR